MSPQCAKPAGAKRGLSRTFQNLQIFQSMTVLENAISGYHLQERGPVLADHVQPAVVAPRRADARQGRRGTAEAGASWPMILPTERRAGLSYGALKRLEIARALGLKPKDPAAGRTGGRLQCRGDRRNRSSDRRGCGVGRGDPAGRARHEDGDAHLHHVVVLDHGEKIAEGDSATVSRDPAVVAAYLGAEAANA
jgi:branched-chain amino acid transport system ATP-binding protein